MIMICENTVPHLTPGVPSTRCRDTHKLQVPVAPDCKQSLYCNECQNVKLV